MTRVFLLGGRGGGGEEVFVRDLAATPPPGVNYSLALDHHESVPGAQARYLREVVLNRLIHPFLWPLPGFRAYEIAPEVDLVHVHNFPAWLKVRPRCPVVYSVGGSTYPHYLETYLGWRRAQVVRRYARAKRLYGLLGVRSEVSAHDRIDAIVVFSDYASEYLLEFGVPEEKVHIVPPGFDIPPPRPRVPSDVPFTFLLVGRHPLRKGADVAVAAFEKMRGRGVGARLILVGDPAYPDMARGVGVEGHGPVDRAALYRDFFGQADAVLVPSRAEGFGFTAVEAMGHGLPVVASNRDALPWIVGEGGLLVEPGSVEALTRSMAELAGDPGQARAVGAAGRRRFDRDFTLELSRGRLGAVYTGLLERA